MASRSTTISSGAAVLLLLVIISMAGLSDVHAASARLMSPPSSWSQLPATTAASSAAEVEELNGIMECTIGCFTQVFGCAFGCLGKGPDMALCVVGCNQKSIVCMLRCAMTPSPPKPKPTPPPPKPTPKPPKPSPPPPGPPYAGQSTVTTLG